MSSVCSDQKKFDDAIKKGTKYLRKQERPGKMAALMSAAIYLILAIWALVLALKVAPSDQQIKHVIMAILAPPVYIVAYYLGN